MDAVKAVTGNAGGADDAGAARARAAARKLAREGGRPARPAPARPSDDALVLIVEGEIAAGKTELATALAARLAAMGLRVRLVLEPVERWKQVRILQKFYGDPARHGYGFQTYAFATRVAEIESAVRSDPSADVYILERSPATDRIFMELQRELVDPVEMEMYQAWCQAWELMLPIDLARAKVVYLKTSLSACMARLASRHREGETGEAAKHDGTATGGVSVEYQERLRRAHEAFLLGAHKGEFPGLASCPFPPGAIFEIEAELADGDFRACGPERERVLSSVLQKLGLSD